MICKTVQTYKKALLTTKKWKTVKFIQNTWDCVIQTSELWTNGFNLNVAGDCSIFSTEQKARHERRAGGDVQLFSSVSEETGRCGAVASRHTSSLETNWRIISRAALSPHFYIVKRSTIGMRDLSLQKGVSHVTRPKHFSKRSIFSLVWV